MVDPKETLKAKPPSTPLSLARKGSLLAERRASILPDGSLSIATPAAAVPDSALAQHASEVKGPAVSEKLSPVPASPSSASPSSSALETESKPRQQSGGGCCVIV